MVNFPSVAQCQQSQHSSKTPLLVPPQWNMVQGRTLHRLLVPHAKLFYQRTPPHSPQPSPRYFYRWSYLAMMTVDQEAFLHYASLAIDQHLIQLLLILMQPLPCLSHVPIIAHDQQGQALHTHHVAISNTRSFPNPAFQQSDQRSHLLVLLLGISQPLRCLPGCLLLLVA